MTRDYDEDTTRYHKITRHYDSNAIAKTTQHQANSERGFVLATPVNHSKKNTQIKQNQANSEQGFRPSLHIIEAYISNKIAKIKQSQARS
jgi:hypothetical protein